MILELPATWLSMFSYPGAPTWMAPWADEPHQFPLYETFS